MLPTIRICLDAAKTQLAQAMPVAEASSEARILMMEVLQVNHAWLLGHALDLLSEQQQTAFNALLARRLQGEPVAHILGHREFFGLQLKVTPDTLIPRPDTETLVEAALEKINRHARGKPLRILDLGTGSGAIALAIAKHGPDCLVTAVDASPAALAVAQHNAKSLGIDNVRFIASHWFSALGEQRYDLIVSNPPYIEADDPHLQSGDLRFEPLSALAAGPDGLSDIRAIIAEASAHLQPGGWLMLEHGYLQAADVATLLQSAGLVNISHATDLAGIQRVTLGQVNL